MILDWTNWTFWLITLALIVFSFCPRDIYDQFTQRMSSNRQLQQLNYCDE